MWCVSFHPVCFVVKHGIFFLSCFLQHRAKGSEDPYKEIDGIATTRYSVGGLSPYSHYDFRVAAVNTIGQGPSSEVVEARTAEQAPSSPPRQVSLMSCKKVLQRFYIFYIGLEAKNAVFKDAILILYEQQVDFNSV